MNFHFFATKGEKTPTSNTSDSLRDPGATMWRSEQNREDERDEKDDPRGGEVAVLAQSLEQPESKHDEEQEHQEVGLAVSGRDHDQRDHGPCGENNGREAPLRGVCEKLVHFWKRRWRSKRFENGLEKIVRLRNSIEFRNFLKTKDEFSRSTIFFLDGTSRPRNCPKNPKIG